MTFENAKAPGKLSLNFFIRYHKMKTRLIINYNRIFFVDHKNETIIAKSSFQMTKGSKIGQFFNEIFL